MEEKEILTKINNKEEFTERELRDLLDFEIEQDKGEDRRWTREVTSILKIGDRYFALNWGQGLTESQLNEYYEQPYEVMLVETQKVVTVREWREKENEEVVCVMFRGE